MIRTTLSLGFSLLLLFVSSCNSPGNSDQSQKDILHPLVSNTDAEKLTIYLGLKELRQTDSSIVYHASALYQEDTVGLQVEILKDIPEGIDGQGDVIEDQAFVEGGMKFTSLGQESDKFVHALQELFDEPAENALKDFKVEPLVFSSNNRKVDLEKQATYSFKLFVFNNYGAEAELFATVDTYKKALMITEKDAIYRKNLLSAFIDE